MTEEGGDRRKGKIKEEEEGGEDETQTVKESGGIPKDHKKKPTTHPVTSLSLSRVLCMGFETQISHLYVTT